MTMTIDWTAVAAKLGHPSEQTMWKELYTKKELSIPALAEKFGVSHTAIRHALVRCGIPRRRPGGPNRKEDPNWPPIEELVQEVQASGVSAVAERLGFSRSSIYKRVRAYQKTPA